jgi:hypothetical protein
VLTPYVNGKTVVPGAVRSMALLEMENGDLDAANARFEEWLSTGAQSYDAMYYLGVIADRREDSEKATRYYSRVTGGDFALVAQSRVARIKAEKSGVDAGPAAPRGIRARASAERPGHRGGPGGVAVELRPGVARARRAERRAREISRLHRPAHGARVLNERTNRVDASGQGIAPAARGSSR